MLQTRQNEEIRKIQFTGGSTYIISLPKRWIAQNQLKRGSFVKFHEEDDGVLALIPSEVIVQKKLDEATIKVSSKDDPETVTRKVVSAYLSGFGFIYIKSEKLPLSTNQRHEIKMFVRRMLVGTEIVSDTTSQLGLQVILRVPELTAQNVLRRMGIITTSMHKDAIMALKTHDKTLAKEVIATDNEVDRFNLFMLRQLKIAIQKPQMIREIGLLSGKDCLSYHLVNKSVERTADHAVNIAQNILELKHQLDNEIMESFERMSIVAIKMFETAVESLFKQDYNLAESIMKDMKSLIGLEKKLISTIQADIADSANLRVIVESIRRIAEYACDIAEVVLNLTIESILV